MVRDDLLNVQTDLLEFSTELTKLMKCVGNTMMCLKYLNNSVDAALQAEESEKTPIDLYETIFKEERNNEKINANPDPDHPSGCWPFSNQ